VVWVEVLRGSIDRQIIMNHCPLYISIRFIAVLFALAIVLMLRPLSTHARPSARSRSHSVARRPSRDDATAKVYRARRIFVLYRLNHAAPPLLNGKQYRDRFSNLLASRDELGNWKIVALVNTMRTDHRLRARDVVAVTTLPSMLAAEPDSFPVGDLLPSVEAGLFPRTFDSTIEIVLHAHRILKANERIEPLHAFLDTADLSRLWVISLTDPLRNRIEDRIRHEDSVFIDAIDSLAGRMHRKVDGMPRAMRAWAYGGADVNGMFHQVVEASGPLDSNDIELCDDMMYVAMRWNRAMVERTNEYYILLGRVDGRIEVVAVFASDARFINFPTRLWVDADAEACLHRFGLDSAMRSLLATADADPALLNDPTMMPRGFEEPSTPDVRQMVMMMTGRTLGFDDGLDHME
jgi:hypothetical protein